MWGAVGVGGCEDAAGMNVDSKPVPQGAAAAPRPPGVTENGIRLARIKKTHKGEQREMRPSCKRHRENISTRRVDKKTTPLVLSIRIYCYLSCFRTSR